MLEPKLLSDDPHRQTNEDIASTRVLFLGPHIMDRCSREAGKHDITSARDFSASGGTLNRGERVWRVTRFKLEERKRGKKDKGERERSNSQSNCSSFGNNTLSGELRKRRERV